MTDFAASDLPFDDPTTPINSFDEGELDVLEQGASYDVMPPLDTDLFDERPREVGQPEALAEYWRFQGDTNDCALYAQGGVLEASGQTFDIQKYREQGLEGGWYSPEDGTYFSSFGDLWEANDLEVTRYEKDATIQDIADELDQNHGVVVGVDTEPIWGEPGGHALWVTGLEIGSDGAPTNVICNDSGRPDGQQHPYPLDHFMTAWNSCNNIMVATQSPLLLPS